MGSPVIQSPVGQKSFGGGTFPCLNSITCAKPIRFHQRASLLGHGGRRDWSSWWGLLLGGKFWPGKVPACLFDRDMIGRTAEPGFGFLHQPRKALLNKTPTPKRSCNCQTQFQGKLSTRMLGSRSCRQIALQATDTCTSRHVRLEISLQDAHCTHGPRKAAAARAPDEMQARCNPFVRR